MQRLLARMQVIKKLANQRVLHPLTSGVFQSLALSLDDIAFERSYCRYYYYKEC